MHQIPLPLLSVVLEDDQEAKENPQPSGKMAGLEDAPLRQLRVGIANGNWHGGNVGKTCLISPQGLTACDFPSPRPRRKTPSKSRQTTRSSVSGFRKSFHFLKVRCRVSALWCSDYFSEVAERLPAWP